MIYPVNFEQKIGLDEISRLLKTKCLSSLGMERVEETNFLTQHEEISRKLAETGEFIRIQQEEGDFPNQYFYDVRESIHRIRIAGTYLEEMELFDLKRSLETIEAIVRFLRREEEESNSTGRYPTLRELTEEVETFPHLTKRIDAILDKFGKIKDSASPELARIRRELAGMAGSISRSLNAILRNAQRDGLVEKDTTPTLRDGRLVIPVAPALKRKIRGIVHDESATGKTVFIEPAEVVEANNRIRELEGEERREIIRILQEFTATVRPESERILEAYQFLATIDYIRAKAMLAIETQSIVPTLSGEPKLDWVMAIHPLLQMSLQKHNKKIVPLDIKLDSRQRILVISGPNAGGKSVCLKTVGLLQYMLQCGMPIPLRENSKTGIFDSIFIDIGDEQSIEDDLSTYSSHLQNMKVMMKHCTHRSLLLIDEFGGGTEPQIGGAIAEAILGRFNQKRTFGVITTHYQNLKHYADDHEGVVNGAMLYDRHHMQALYQLQIGNPGSSFAVEIARKIGIPDEVIKEASEIVGSEYIAADKYLQDIVRDKRYWENKRQNIHQREKQMELTVTKYQTEMEELQQKRKAILSEARTKAEEMLKASNAVIEQTIRTIKEAQAEKERTRSARHELEEFRTRIQAIDAQEQEDKIAKKIQQLQARKERREERKEKKANDIGKEKAAQQRIQQERAKQEAPLVVGDTVRIKGQTSVGTLTELQGKNAIVTFGTMRTNVKIDRLMRAKKPKKEETQAVSFVSKSTQDAVYERKLHFKQDLDVRGMRGDEALHAVTYFIDDAILWGIARVRILHGTGTGALRSLIRQYLNTVPGVARAKDEHVQFGGAGITVVDLED